MANRKDGLYAQLDQQCNAEQIQDLLREYKAVNKTTKKEILVTGNKPAILAQLQRAIAQDHIPLQVAIDLLRKCEENGQQHIFYYRPKPGQVDRCRDFDRVQESLFGVDPTETFPIYDYPKEGYQWVDARKGLSGKPHDWALKAYGQDSFNQVESRKERAGKIYLVLAPVFVKAVCLVRWNNPDLLEVRIDSAGLDSVSKRERRLQSILDMLDPALPQKLFDRWSLEKARSFIASNHKSHPDFEAARLTMIDRRGGKIEVSCQTDEDTIEELPSRSAAVLAISRDKGRGHAVSLNWKLREPLESEPNGQKDEFERLSCVCGGKYTHEIAISARVAPDVVDHVTTKLREFNR